jgi:hypothetical protein
VHWQGLDYSQVFKNGFLFTKPPFIPYLNILNKRFPL